VKGKFVGQSTIPRLLMAGNRTNPLTVSAGGNFSLKRNSFVGQITGILSWMSALRGGRNPLKELGRASR